MNEMGGSGRGKGKEEEWEGEEEQGGMKREGETISTMVHP